MRLVIDTNVFVSAALKEASVPALAVCVAAERGRLLKSSATERQLFEVLGRPHFVGLIAPATRTWLRTLLELSEPVPIVERVSACRDPTDDRFLELAVNGRADVLVTGDPDLLVLHPFRAIPILSPAAFVHLTIP